MTKVIIGLILCSALLLCADEGEHDSIPHPTSGPLPKVILTSSSATYTNWHNGIPVTTTAKKLSMSIDGGPSERVRGVGSNLAEYMRPVPEAYDYMRRYKASKITAWSLIGGGMGVLFGGLAGMINSSDEMPSFALPIVGFLLIGSCNIPYAISRKYPENAVEVYNREMGKPEK